MRPRYIMASVLGLVAVGSLTIRLPLLGLRPMHADEAVQARRFCELWQGTGYRYDPDEFHGPLLSYATLPSIWISRPETFAETTEYTFRVVPVVFGAGLIVLLVLLADGLGKTATIGASCLMACSPAMVFYSRYYIHEMLLTFFALAAIATAWRYRCSRRLQWCLATGICVGMMQATKETAVLAYLAAGLASLSLLTMPRHAASRGEHAGSGWQMACALGAAILVAVVFLSSFGGHLRGPIDGVLTYVHWLRRAGGESVHVHPWYFYLQRLVWWRLADGPLWSEGLILLLATVGVSAAFLRPGSLPSDTDPRLIRWLSVYTLALTAVYSVIPYKTPWCLLQFLLGFVLLAGVGLAVLLRPSGAIGRRAAVSLALSVLLIHLVWQAYRASFVMPTDPRNPYVYAQTVDDVLRLADDLQQLAQATEGKQPCSLKVIWNDSYYWPLPWYLRRWERVGYWTRIPEQLDDGVVISAPQLDAILTERLKDTHLMTGYYGVRPGVMAQLWVRMDVWQDHLRRLGRLPVESP